MGDRHEEATQLYRQLEESKTALDHQYECDTQELKRSLQAAQSELMQAEQEAKKHEASFESESQALKRSEKTIAEKNSLASEMLQLAIRMNGSVPSQRFV